MEYSIERVNRENYQLFDDMLFCRINGRKKNEHERAEVRNFDAVYITLENQNLHVFAVLIADKFVGWISLVYIPKIGRTNGRGHLFVDELYVHPAYRKQGLARALLEQADVLSKEMNTLGIRLYVNTAYNEAISLYERCGYEHRGEALFMDKEWED